MKTLFAIIASLVIAMPIGAQANDRFLKQMTDVLCMTPDATGLCLAIANHDNEGLKQLGLSAATCLAANYALEFCVKKDRPDGMGEHSFPSTHTAVAFHGSSFLLRRYGLKWGLPAYALSGFVAWGRVHTNRHDWWDALGGAIIGSASAFVFTRPFAGNVDVTIVPTALSDRGYGLAANIRF